MENIETTTVEIVYNFINTLDLQQLEKMKKNILEDMELELPVGVMEDRVKELKYISYRIDTLRNTDKSERYKRLLNDNLFKSHNYDYSKYLAWLQNCLDKAVAEENYIHAGLVQKLINLN